MVIVLFAIICTLSECGVLAPGALGTSVPQVVPGWFDKSLRWRHKSTAALDSVVLLAPNPEWVRTLPNGKLPDRQDFVHYGTDTAARVRAWQAATSASGQLAEEFAQWLERPDMRAVQPL